MLHPAFLLGAAELDVLLRALKAGLRHADVAQEKAALFMGINKGQLSREINGGGGLNLKRLAELPKEALQWWAVTVLQELDMPVELQQASRVTRMLKMVGPASPERSASCR